jgi:hypothetical protein
MGAIFIGEHRMEPKKPAENDVFRGDIYRRLPQFEAFSEARHSPAHDHEAYIDALLDRPNIAGVGNLPKRYHVKCVKAALRVIARRPATTTRAAAEQGISAVYLAEMLRPINDDAMKYLAYAVAHSDVFPELHIIAQVEAMRGQIGVKKKKRKRVA